MKRNALLACAGAVLMVAAVARAITPTVEVLCLTTPTRVPRSATSTGWQLYNHGPNNIFYARGANPADGGPPYYPDGGLIIAVDDCTVIAPEGKDSASDPSSVPLWCVAATAAQVHGAATILNESFGP